MPACLAREVILSWIFRPLIAIYARRTVSGHEHLAALDGPGGVRRQPLQPHGHAAAPARAPVALAPAHRGGRGRRLLLHARLARVARLAGVQHGAGRAQGRDAGARRHDARPRARRRAGACVVFAEGTRSRDGERRPAALRRRGDRRRCTTCRSCPSTSPAPTTRCRSAAGGRGAGRGARGTRSSVSFGPPIRGAEGEHRTEVMERVRLFLESQGATTTPDKRAAARAGSTA